MYSYSTYLLLDGKLRGVGSRNDNKLLLVRSDKKSVFDDGWNDLVPKRTGFDSLATQQLNDACKPMEIDSTGDKGSIGMLKRSFTVNQRKKAVNEEYDFNFFDKNIVEDSVGKKLRERSEYKGEGGTLSVQRREICRPTDPHHGNAKPPSGYFICSLPYSKDELRDGKLSLSLKERKLTKVKHAKNWNPKAADLHEQVKTQLHVLSNDGNESKHFEIHRKNKNIFRFAAELIEKEITNKEYPIYAFNPKYALELASSIIVSLTEDFHQIVQMKQVGDDSKRSILRILDQLEVIIDKALPRLGEGEKHDIERLLTTFQICTSANAFRSRKREKGKRTPLLDCESKLHMEVKPNRMGILKSYNKVRSKVSSQDLENKGASALNKKQSSIGGTSKENLYSLSNKNSTNGHHISFA